MRNIVAKSLFEVQPNATVAIDGDVRFFPVNRVFCVGRNFAEHAAEMGMLLIAAHRFISRNPHNLSAMAKKVCNIPWEHKTTTTR
jgi:2-keto-4-pentenoate hydratase/2-oxohepta-3-ene-1,7-dioic acid hydratase in catechol pathway